MPRLTPPETVRDAAAALYAQGRFDEALAMVRSAAEWAAGDPDLRYVEGVVLESLGLATDAERAYRAALAGAPSHPGAWINLGRLLDRRGETRQAAACYDRVLQDDPDQALALSNLGEIFHRWKDLATARALLEAACSRDPTLPDAAFNLARVRLAEFRPDDARALFETAARLADPADSRFADAFLLASLCSPEASPAELESRHRAWGRDFMHRCGSPARPARAPARRPGHPLAVGLLSGDFNEHPASRFLEPLFAYHDPARMRLTAYHTLGEEDATTQRLRRHADAWRTVAGWSTDRLAGAIEDDRIDVLIDLSGHTRGARFDVLARRPAPLLGEWLGYLHPSGLPAIDFRIADPLMEPEAAGDPAALLLPDGIWCYAPHPDSPPIEDADPGETPRRPFRFGAFNNPMKLNDRVLGVWAEVLAAAPHSTLTIVGFDIPEARAAVTRTMAAGGVAADRLRFLPKMPIRDYLAELGRTDLCLDPFPYGGGTTTFDALWMGTPVLTLAGDRACGRGSAAILCRLGLGDLIATNLDAYRNTAVGLARQPATPAAGRRALRDRLQRSPLTNGPAFCGAFEAALSARLAGEKISQ